MLEQGWQEGMQHQQHLLPEQQQQQRIASAMATVVAAMPLEMPGGWQSSTKKRL